MENLVLTVLVLIVPVLTALTDPVCPDAVCPQLACKLAGIAFKGQQRKTAAKKNKRTMRNQIEVAHSVHSIYSAMYQ